MVLLAGWGVVGIESWMMVDEVSKQALTVRLGLREWVLAEELDE